MKLKKLLNTSLIKWKVSGIMALLFISGISFSQTMTVQVGNGTNTGFNTAPVNSYYNFSYSQTIYSASDIIAAGGVNALVNKIRMYYASGNYANSSVWNIYMGNTTHATFTNNTNWEPIANLSLVYSGTVPVPAAGNWMEITLNTPFLWDGVSNIIVAVDQNQAGYDSNMTFRSSVSGSGSKTIYHYSDGTNANPASPPTASGTSTSYTNIQFVLSPTSNCTGTPSAVVLTTAPNDTICINQPFTLTAQGDHFYTGINYQWQEFDGTNWNDIVNDTNKIFTSAGLTANNSYRAIVECELSAMSVISDTVDMEINSNPIVIVDLAESAFCDSDVATITASGASTYAWTPATGLDNTNTASVNANPGSTTTYTVTGTDVNGCSSTATAKVIPNDELNGNVNINPSENCSPGTLVSSTVSGLTANASGGTWEYRFLEADGITVAQNWNSNNSFDYLPTQDSLYEFYYQFRNTACPTQILDSVKFSFAVGFGGDVTSVDYDCMNMGGTINVNNVFGQLETNTVYQNAFATAADATGVTMTGAAAITGGRLVLTPSQGSSAGAASFNSTSTQMGPGNSMNVKFNMTMDQPINVGADGLAYSFGDDVLTTSGSLQNGRGSKLRLSFDAIDNSPSNGNLQGVYLVYGWNTTTEYGPASNGVLAFSPSTAAWFNKTDVLVELSISSNGKAKVTVDGQVIFENIQMPPAYMNADASTWKHHFGAQTGGYAFRQAINNMTVTTGTLDFGLSQGNVSTLPATWQSNGSFSNLAPGTYHVWLSKDGSASCAKNIETIEIVNTNPVVALGNDTTICEGETLMLDAGNAGATYTWSNTNAVTQQISVNNAGSYVAYVTAPNGCLGIGTINVDVQDAPSANGIFMQGTYPNMNFTVINAQNANTYDWNFGDGTVVNNAPGSINHTYAADGNFTVTATLANSCDTVDVTETFNIENTLSLNENTISGLSVYPNPTSGLFTVRLDDQTETSVMVFDMTGAVVLNNVTFSGSSVIDASNWEKGVYFVQITNQGMNSTSKVVVK